MSRKNTYNKKKSNVLPPPPAIPVDDSDDDGCVEIASPSAPSTSTLRRQKSMIIPPQTPEPKKAGWKLRFVDEEDEDEEEVEQQQQDVVVERKCKSKKKVKQECVVADDDDTIQLNEKYFKDADTYNGFTIRFLHEEEYVNLKHPVLIDYVTYGVEIVDIHKDDRKTLEKTFLQWSPFEPVLGKRLFIRDRGCKIEDKNKNIVRNFVMGQKYFIKINIQGVKHKEGVLSPVWKINMAEMV